MSYQFCPSCGAKRANFTPLRPFRCESCEHTSFFGPVAAVGGVVIAPDRRILLIERAKEPGMGKLGMPGGFVDPFETAEDALKREVREEVGLSIQNIRYLMSAPNRYVYRGIEIPVIDFFYQVDVEGIDQIAADVGEVAGWIWTELTDEVLEKMAFDSNREALRYYRALRGSA